MIDADAYFFDIDGTLMTCPDRVHWDGMYKAMHEVYRVDANLESIPYHGKTDVSILRIALTGEGLTDAAFYGSLPRALSVVREHVSENLHRIAPKVCPGIPVLLGEIHDAGRLLGVASGNLEEVGWHKIRAARLRRFFQLGSFGDSHELRAGIFEQASARAKEILGSDANVCFVGDTPEDIAAARSVNAKIIAVGTGKFSRDVLAAHAPDLCCTSCAELVGKLNRTQTA